MAPPERPDSPAGTDKATNPTLSRVTESSRSAAIVDFDLENLVDDPHLDAICRILARQCDAPVALVSLVEETEQRFLGKAGTDLCSTPRTTSFCATTMLDHKLMVVPDARRDPRFADYSIVTQDPHVRFYAGAPLITAEGIPLGALCVLDFQPHEAGLSAEQQEMMLLMAEAVMDRLSLRRAARDERVAAHKAATALDESDLRFNLLADAMPQMAWSSRPDGHTDYFNARWYEFTGLEPGASEGEEWTKCLHPDDLERTGAAWQHSLATGDPYDLEYRLRRADGAYRWALTRGLPMRDAKGGIIRWFGTCTDIHDHRVAMEEREIISQELSHRIKNIFAVISGLIGLSARETPAFRPIADTLRERILALGRAHDFVRPHSRDSRPEPVKENSLHGLLTDLFAPYEDGPGARIRIHGDDIMIDDRSATPLALLFHEVVTNGAKYGALSVPDGKIDLAIRMDGADHVEMRWCETGGPAITGEIHNSGFGSRLLDLSVRRQLGGDFEQKWPVEGLIMTIRVPLTAFSRQRRA